MGSSLNMVIVFGVGIIAMFVLSGNIEALTCIGAKQDLSPCITYLTGHGASDKPDQSCCAGVQDLNHQANSTDARRSICSCLIGAAVSYSVDFTRASQLPQFCGVGLPFPVDPKVNCSSIP